MEKKTLIPRKVINVAGKMHYNESNQAWSNIKFKKELVDEFPQLKDKRSNFSYEILFYRDTAELEKTMNEIKKKKGDVLPLLMFFYQDDKN